MWLMTSRGPKRSRSWPENLWSAISQQPCKIRGRCILTTNRKPHIASPMVTWPMTSRDHERSRSWPQYLWNLITQKPCEIDTRFKLSTYRKLHIRSPIVMWLMTSRDPKGQDPYLTLPYLRGGCQGTPCWDHSLGPMRNPDRCHGRRNLLEAFANLRRAVQWIPLRVSSECVITEDRSSE